MATPLGIVSYLGVFALIKQLSLSGFPVAPGSCICRAHDNQGMAGAILGPAVKELIALQPQVSQGWLLFRLGIPALALFLSDPLHDPPSS